MNKKPVVPVDGVDLQFRPSTYFPAWGPPLLTTVKGHERRAAVARLMLSSGREEIPDLTQELLCRADRRELARIHPALMGGEYLPDRVEREVEIARITIASVTQDVTCVYARRQKSRICYRVVDEYDGETLTDKRARTSLKPLTLGELEAFFMGAWPLLDVLDGNFEDSGCDIEEMQGFVVSIESYFYPHLDTLLRARIDAWAEERSPSGFLLCMGNDEE